MDVHTRQLLKSALIACGRDTRMRLQPLLHIEAVQQLLAAFLSDTSRPFEDWVLDPYTQSLLRQLAQLAEATDVQRSGLNDLLVEECDAAAARQAMRESSTPEARRPMIVMEVQRIREEAKVHFREGYVQNAKKLYESALALCIRTDEDGVDPGLAPTIAGLHVNIAICNNKSDDWPGVLEACSAALKHEPTNVKALYWRAKYHVSNCAYDVAIDDLQAAMLEDESNREALLLLEHCQQNLHEQHASRRLAQMEKDANLAQWQARKSGAQLPQSKQEFLERARSQLHSNADSVVTSLGPGMPRPPALNHKSKSPTQLLQQYISCCPKNTVEVWDESCKLADGRRGFKCNIKHPGVAAATGEDSSKKKAKQRAALAFLQALYPVYMERNPTDRAFETEETAPTSEMMANVFNPERGRQKEGEQEMKIADLDDSAMEPPQEHGSVPSAVNPKSHRGKSKRRRGSHGHQVQARDASNDEPPTADQPAETPIASADPTAEAPMEMDSAITATKRKERHGQNSGATSQATSGQQRRSQHKPRATATPDFHAYTRAWVAQLLNGRFNRLVFPAGLRGVERTYIMEYVYYHPEGRQFSVNVARYLPPGKQTTNLKSVVVSRIGYLPRPGILDSMDVPPPPYMPEGHAQQLTEARAAQPHAVVPRRWIESAEALTQTEAIPRLSTKETEAFQGYLDSWTSVLVMQQVKGVKFPKNLSATHRAHLLRWSRTHTALHARVEARVAEGACDPDLSVLRLVIDVKDAPSSLEYISAPAW